MKISSKQLADVALTALAPIIWGSTYLITSDYLPPDRPFIAAFIRVFPAGLLLLLWCRQWPRQDEWWKVVVLAFLNIGAFQALLFVSAYRLPGGQAAVLMSVQPLVLMLMMYWAEGKKYPLPAVVSAFAALLGMALLFLGDGFVWDGIGIAASLSAAVFMALGLYGVKRWRLSLSVMASTGWQLLLGGVMLAPIAYAIDPALPPLAWSEILAYAYLVVFGAVLSYALMFRGIRRLPAVAAGSLGLLSPITAVILGWVVLGQAVQGIGLLGLILVLVSILVLQLSIAE